MTIAAHDVRMLVVGLGATGFSAARYLAERDVDVTVVDSRAAPPGLAALRNYSPGVAVVLESEDTALLDGIDQVVLSPGLALDSPFAEAARARGIPVVGDIELFARDATAPVLAVTGSNGKSTVVTLLDRMLSAAGVDVAAGGNLGPPALDLLAEPAEIFLLEISSFQLESTHSLTPEAAVVLNVSADHLDRHGTLAEYAEIKAKLLRAARTAVVNWDDRLVRDMSGNLSRVIPYSLHEVPENGFGITTHGGEPWLAHAEGPLLRAADLRLPGAHNQSNALAALALASVLGRDLAPQLDVLREFPGLPHRCQWVAARHGVTYVNDSKATNVAATVAALEGLDGPFVLIAGGQAKGADLAPLAAAGRNRLLGAVLIGEAAERLAETLGGICPTRRAASLDAAVAAAHEMAEPGSTVLLSPACASFDMFSDYSERGAAFAAAVEDFLT